MYSHAANLLLELTGTIKEKTGKNDGVATLFTGGRKEPWCGHACAWAHRSAGTPLPGDVAPNRSQRNPIALVDTMERELKYVRAWKPVPTDPALMVEQLKPGALIFHKARGGSDPSSTGRHVDMLLAVKDGKLIVARPNWGNAMPIGELDPSDASIAGFANWPIATDSPARAAVPVELPPLEAAPGRPLRPTLPAPGKPEDKRR